ncbi:MAG: bifunctional diaminohydroxyphosphoribosylaminopyrimidine deaminase/5-amino-6-(5-phosphoribosylamino)uracil reductase RibD [Nannocystaceae bacterium]
MERDSPNWWREVGMSRTLADRGMDLALRLAARGEGSTYPNPCVGATVVHRDQIVSSARTRPTGQCHAEVRALKRAGSGAHGAVLFVTLEPCSHVGRTPPCTAAIIEAGIQTVVIGVRDPASHASGRGLSELRRAGLRVIDGFRSVEAARVHAHYLHHVATGLPWVTLKVASSLDGQIACADGDSKWITSEAARRNAHRERARHHAVAVGAATVRCDDPRLDVRHVRGVDPRPIAFDSRLRLSSSASWRFLRSGALILHTAAASRAAVLRTKKLNAQLVEVDADTRGRVSVAGALEALGTLEIRSVLVEGGGEMLASFVREKHWQRWLVYQAPRLLGQGRPMLPGLAWTRVVDAPQVRLISRRKLGDDLLWILAPKGAA